MPLPFLFQIGFLPVDIWDIFDVLVVGYLIYWLYRLLKGSIALNIFVGIVALFFSYQAFTALGMDLLSNILNQFIQVGFISLIIIFQPEVRRFLLLLGSGTIKQRDSFWNRLLGREEFDREHAPQTAVVRRAFLRMARQRTGALIVCTQDADPEYGHHRRYGAQRRHQLRAAGQHFPQGKPPPRRGGAHLQPTDHKGQCDFTGIGKHRSAGGGGAAAPGRSGRNRKDRRGLLHRFGGNG